MKCGIEGIFSRSSLSRKDVENLNGRKGLSSLDVEYLSIFNGCQSSQMCISVLS